MKENRIPKKVNSKKSPPGLNVSIAICISNISLVYLYHIQFRLVCVKCMHHLMMKINFEILRGTYANVFSCNYLKLRN